MLRFASASSPSNGVSKCALISYRWSVFRKEGKTRGKMQARKRKLTKYTPRVQIRAQKLTVAFQPCLGRQTRHVRATHQLLQELA